jgi:hypothetical protein
MGWISCSLSKRSVIARSVPSRTGASGTRRSEELSTSSEQTTSETPPTRNVLEREEQLVN